MDQQQTRSKLIYPRRRPADWKSCCLMKSGTAEHFVASGKNALVRSGQPHRIQQALFIPPVNPPIDFPFSEFITQIVQGKYLTNQTSCFAAKYNNNPAIRKEKNRQTLHY